VTAGWPNPQAWIFFPLVVRAFGLLATIVAIFFVRGKEDEDPMNMLNRGYWVTTLLSVVGLAITTKCTTTAIASQWVPTDLRWALATTMVGASAAIPPPYVAPPSRPDLDGTISAQWCTSAVTDSLPCGRTYPNNASTDPMTWVADATTASTGSKIFLPYVPPVIDTPAFAGGYDLDLGGGQKCKIFFPGRYTDNVVITGTIPVSTRTVATPIVPWPHMGRQPLASMYTTP